MSHTEQPPRGKSARKRCALEAACIDRMVANGENPTAERIAEAIGIELKTFKNTISGGTQPKINTIVKISQFLAIDRSQFDALFTHEERTFSEEKYGAEDMAAPVVDVDSLTKVSEIPGNFTWLKSRKYQASAILLVFALLIGLTLKNITSVSDAALSEATIFPNAETCLIDFTQTLPGSKDCGSIGTISVEGPNMGRWNGLVTAIDVPLHWTVYARYEKWEPPKYDHFKEYGYVLLSPGLNRFDVMSFQLYKDFDLKTHVKVTEPHEMNDRIQYLIVTSATSDATLMIYGHKELEHPEKLAVSVHTSADN